jgi:hypothetical protein
MALVGNGLTKGALCVVVFVLQVTVLTVRWATVSLTFAFWLEGSSTDAAEAFGQVELLHYAYNIHPSAQYVNHRLFFLTPTHSLMMPL